jgi:hypothetical protein
MGEEPGGDDFVPKRRRPIRQKIQTAPLGKCEDIIPRLAVLRQKLKRLTDCQCNRWRLPEAAARRMQPRIGILRKAENQHTHGCQQADGQQQHDGAMSVSLRFDRQGENRELGRSQVNKQHERNREQTGAIAAATGDANDHARQHNQAVNRDQ